MCPPWSGGDLMVEKLKFNEWELFEFQPWIWGIPALDMGYGVIEGTASMTTL